MDNSKLDIVLSTPQWNIKQFFDSRRALIATGELMQEFLPYMEEKYSEDFGGRCGLDIREETLAIIEEIIPDHPWFKVSSQLSDIDKTASELFRHKGFRDQPEKVLRAIKATHRLVLENALHGETQNLVTLLEFIRNATRDSVLNRKAARILATIPQMIEPMPPVPNQKSGAAISTPTMA